MPPLKFQGPVCQTKDCYRSSNDGTLRRGTLPSMPQSVPSTTGWTASTAASKASQRVVAKGRCSFLNPQARGTVMVPPEAFARLRRNSGAATISPPQFKASQTWPNGSASAAIEQEIQIDNQKIKVIRPTDDAARGKNFPTTKQVGEALRAVPAYQRAHTTTFIVCPTAAKGSSQHRTILGEGGSGQIILYPADQAQSQNDFDNRVMHESGHNFHGKFWQGGPAEVKGWQNGADADYNRPSPYAAATTGDDFAEFIILYNAAKHTPCEAIAKQMYPSRWKKIEEYRSR